MKIMALKDKQFLQTKTCANWGQNKIYKTAKNKLVETNNGQVFV
jgi:hypothetical protein